MSALFFTFIFTVWNVMQDKDSKIYEQEKSISELETKIEQQDEKIKELENDISNREFEDIHSEAINAYNDLVKLDPGLLKACGDYPSARTEDKPFEQFGRLSTHQTCVDNYKKNR